MMIQTFVENSIKYGFSNPIRDQLKIGIRVLEEEEIYSITIRDNGKGFPPEVLKSCRRKVLWKMRTEIISEFKIH